MPAPANTPDDPCFRDRPRAPRRRAAGLATLSAKGFSAQCELVDVSVGGAQVRLLDVPSGPIPTSVVFEERSFRRPHDAEVRWRSGPLVGLALKPLRH